MNFLQIITVLSPLFIVNSRKKWKFDRNTQHFLCGCSQLSSNSDDQTSLTDLRASQDVGTMMVLAKNCLHSHRKPFIQSLLHCFAHSFHSTHLHKASLRAIIFFVIVRCFTHTHTHTHTHIYTHLCQPCSVKAPLVYGKRMFLSSVGLDEVMQLVLVSCPWPCISTTERESESSAAWVSVGGLTEMTQLSITE